MPAKTLSKKLTPTLAKPAINDIYLSKLGGSKESIAKQASIPETITALDNYPPLLRIPSEIRREIFRYVLPSSTQRFTLYTDCDSTAISKKWNRKCRPHPDKLTLDVLRTNRLIYHECLSILYSENLFHFYAFNYLPVLDFIRHLSPEAKSLVRKVRLTPLTENGDEEPANHNTFCTVVHDCGWGRQGDAPQSWGHSSMPTSLSRHGCMASNHSSGTLKAEQSVASSFVGEKARFLDYHSRL